MVENVDGRRDDTHMPALRIYKLWNSLSMIDYFRMIWSDFGLTDFCEQEKILERRNDTEKKLTLLQNILTFEIFEYLKSIRIRVCGTVRSNRKDLSILDEDRLKREGDFYFCITD